MARALRIRNHVNPLSEHYAVPRARAIAIPAHLGTSPPIDVELGCADAQFSFQLAASHPERLVVALDIRTRIVEHGRERAGEAGLANLDAIAPEPPSSIGSDRKWRRRPAGQSAAASV